MVKRVETAASETGWIELPHGKVRRDPENTGYGWAVCYDCPEPRDARYVVIPYGKQLEALSGRCHSCRNKASSASRYAGLEAALRARVPGAPQKLLPWKSVIHWPDMRRVWYAWKNGDRRGARLWAVPVTCGVCGVTRDCKLVGVQGSGMLSEKNLPPPRKGQPFTGVHSPCGLKRHLLENELPDGSEVFPWDIEADSTPAVCGACGKRQTVRFDASDLDGLEWDCVRCGHIIGEQPHPTGARLFWLSTWLKRAR